MVKDENPESGKPGSINKDMPGFASLRDLLHKQSTYIWKWNRKNAHIEVDELFYEKLGLPQEGHTLADRLYRILHKADKYKWLRFQVKLRNQQCIGNIDIRFRHRDGNYLWFRITTENNQEPDSRMGLLHDITKDKEFLALTQNRSARLEASIQNNFGLNIIIDARLNIKYVHNAGSILRQLAPQTMQHLTIDSLFEKSERKKLLSAVEQILDAANSEIKTEIWTNPVYTKAPKCLELIIINKLEDPLIQGIVVDARDITPHIELEQELKKQKEEYLNLLEEYEDQNRKIKIKNEILENKNAEIAEANEKLTKSEHRILSLSRIVNEAITILENDQKVYISERLGQITGYPPEELYNIDITHLAAPGEKIVPVKTGKDNAYEINFWGYTKNGEKKYFSNIYYTEKSPGKPTYTFIITTDKTHEKIQNELLRENQMKLKATLESLQKWIIVVDNKGYIISFYKPTTTAYFILDEDIDPLGKHYTELPLPDSFIEKLLNVGIKVQKEAVAQSIEVPLEIKGRTRWYYINVALRYSTTGQNIGWTLVMDDITRIKATEMELKNRESQLFSLINHFPDIVCLKDNENRWVLANKSLLDLYGIKNQPYLLKTCREMAIKYPENKKIYNKCAETDALAWHKKDQIKYDMNFDRPDQTPRSYEIIKVPIFDNDGHPAWLIMLGRDVTERDQMTRELEYAKENAEQADQLKTAFLTNMSHELRTPLNGIVGFSHLLKNSRHNIEEQHEFLNIIYESSNMLLNIINDIIDLSKMETGQIKINIKPVNIKELVTEAYTYYQKHYEKSGINLEVKLPPVPDTIIIDTDKVRLQQILNNLVANAYKFTKKGTITIAVAFDENNEYLIINVKDTGIGIDAKNHETIFERFRQVEEGYTREFGGAGLGLAITKKLVGMLGGNIKVQSAPNKGATFSVYLPYITTPADHKEETVPPDISFIQDKSVLAVEDDAGSYLLLKSILRNTGCNLLHAQNGKEAMEIINKHRHIDLVLMDVQMPVMDGLEATRKIKSLNDHIPVIAQTAHAFTNDREKCMMAGCDEFITKPIKFNELFNAMYKTMMGRSLNT